jgi:hypothetical protein
MEKKMKKLMLVAALGAAAIFTACGDDDSSSAKAGTFSCEVKVEGQSVITDWDIEGKKTQDVYTVEGDSIKIKTADTTMVEPLNEAIGVDLAAIEEYAKKGCETAIKMYEEDKNAAK